MPYCRADTFHGKDGGIQVLAGLALSSQTLLSLLRTPGCQSCLEKFSKSEFDEFTSIENYTQLLLIKPIWQIQ